MTNEIPTVDLFAACTTIDCPALGQSIAVRVPAPATSALVICGACAQPITNITDTQPIPDTEVPEWLT